MYRLVMEPLRFNTGSEAPVREKRAIVMNACFNYIDMHSEAVIDDMYDSNEPAGKFHKQVCTVIDLLTYGGYMQGDNFDEEAPAQALYDALRSHRDELKNMLADATEQEQYAEIESYAHDLGHVESLIGYIQSHATVE